MFIFVTLVLAFMAIFLVLSLFEFEFDRQAQTPYSRGKLEYFSDARQKGIFIKGYERFKYFVFLFRWFLIGKYHCNIPQKYKAFYWLVNKALWVFIMLCVWYFFVAIFEGKA